MKISDGPEVLFKPGQRFPLKNEDGYLVVEEVSVIKDIVMIKAYEDIHNEDWEPGELDSFTGNTFFVTQDEFILWTH